MKKETHENKIVTIQGDGTRGPVVLNSKTLFNLCCLGLVRVGTEEEDGSFNGRIFVEIGKLFFKEGFTDVSVYQSLDVNGSYDINVYFKIKHDELHPKKHEFDEEEDWFCVSILNGRYNGGRYLRFSRDSGEVYFHDRVKESDYKPGSFYNEGCKNIEHPLTKIEFAKMKNDIEITLKNRNEWW